MGHMGVRYVAADPRSGSEPEAGQRKDIFRYPSVLLRWRVPDGKS